MKLTLDIVNKIRNNCNDRGTYAGYTDSDKEEDLTYCEINVYKADKQEFKQYSLIETNRKNEYEKYTMYHITLEDGADIQEAFEYAIDEDEECNDYNLNDWLEEYEEDLETNEEVINLTEQFLYKELKIEL